MAAKKSDGYEKLRLQIKNGELKNLYLFFGEEEYIKEEYVRKVMDMIPEDPLGDFNTVKIEGSASDFDMLEDALENFPMMAEKKTILIKDSGIFKASKKEAEADGDEKNAVKKFWTEKLKKIADYVVLIFDEKEVDKRSALYKAAVKNGVVGEFSHLNAAELTQWANGEFLKSGKKISKENAEYFTSLCEKDLSSVKNEMDKLISYCGDEILKSDIDRLVSKSLEIRIFEITDGILEKNPEKTMTALNEMKAVKEPTFRILYTLSSAFEKILYARLGLDDGMLYKDIETKLGVHPFVAKKYINSAKMFSTAFLIDRVRKIAEVDFSIKQGEINEWDALENYIAECIYNKAASS